MRAHGVPTARMYEFCLRRVRAGGRIWLKLFVSVDGHECPLEKVDYCGQECMRAQPRCEVGQGCRQRGIHSRARLFDGFEWCNNPHNKEYQCRYDFNRLGLDYSAGNR